VLASIVNLNSPDRYLHWGFILISLANFLVVVAMVVLFALALTLPFIHSRRRRAGGATTQAPPSPSPSAPAPSAGAPPSPAPDPGGDPTLWTRKLRGLWLRRLPPEKLLPDSQPAYVASWIYVFGVLTLAGLVVAVLSGLVLALEGPVWWHTSAVGHFFNSLHLWSVECFMGFMAIHLWGKFWMASWRGRRALTWMTGVVAFLVSVFEGYTGYLSQTNFDSQWIAYESKDAMNSAGIGAFFNAMNFGQALMLHIVFVPLVLVVIVAIHIVMVRLRGVVHPIDASPEHLGTADAYGTGSLESYDDHPPAAAPIAAAQGTAAPR
jgi:quinol-cytochrome oxidoreductase complex cytochrome b subunit